MTTRIALSLCLFGAGCSYQHVEPSNKSMPISFVSSSELNRESTELTGRWPSGHGEYETWERYHDSLVEVAKRYGSVSWDPSPLPDFYFSGDWFHDRSDWFSLHSKSGLSAEALRDFQGVVASHLPDTRLCLHGQSDPIDGVEVLITSSRILVSWGDLSPKHCREKLAELGLHLE